ncbi:hypothetical protein [Spirosoma spitsbergense]|jgi:hypothetical protein|uniref:hypothetical protein n=1 Tax=Spirosoma spitsbergense TaxID=431554 RepID=UPI00036AAD67|nr:hypothetical protein [Spirosoma spitsbergense]
MEAINYLTDADGRRKAIVIDLDELKRSGQTGHDVVMYLQEDLEDLLDVELVKHEETIPWEDLKKELKNEGLLDG